MIKFEIKGNPATKKNGQQLGVRKDTGKPYTTQGKTYKSFAKDALIQLRPISNKLENPYNERLFVECRYYVPILNKDLVNLLIATHDILQESKIIKNDIKIIYLGSSRIVGRDKENPRTEITIMTETEYLELKAKRLEKIKEIILKENEKDVMLEEILGEIKSWDE